MPQLAEVKIEDVDLGKLTFEKTDEGILVLPGRPNGVRIKVDGKFVNANDFFKDLGFDSEEDTPAIADDAILVVERDGTAYLGTCSEIQDFGGSGLQDVDLTPVVSNNPATLLLTPGANRQHDSYADRQRSEDAGPRGEPSGGHAGQRRRRGFVRERRGRLEDHGGEGQPRRVVRGAEGIDVQRGAGCQRAHGAGHGQGREHLEGRRRR